MAKLKAATRGNAELVIGATRRQFAFSPCVEIPSEDDGSEHEAQVAHQEQQGNADRSAFGALVVAVDIRHGEVRAKDLDRRARAVALEGVLVEKHSAVMLDDHVKTSPPENDRRQNQSLPVHKERATGR